MGGGGVLRRNECDSKLPRFLYFLNYLQESELIDLIPFYPSGSYIYGTVCSLSCSEPDMSGTPIATCQDDGDFASDFSCGARRLFASLNEPCSCLL